MPPQKSNIIRGEIYWVNLDPTVGTEIKKTRPAVIVSNDAQNRVGLRVIVAPITSQVNRVFPFEVLIDLNGDKSKVMLDQIRTVDCRRLGSRLGKLIIEDIEALDKALKLALNLG